MIDFASSLDDLAMDDLAPCPASASREERRVRRRKVEAVGEEIVRLSAHITAATYRRLVLIHAFDLSEGWREAGFRSCAKWLSWKTGMSPGAAREKVRVARALAELPALSDALRRGRGRLRGDVRGIGGTRPPPRGRALYQPGDGPPDGGCRFPGCGSRFCDAHHIVPWAEGGETNLDNLVLLCRHHHRRVHEDGWSVEMEVGGGQEAAGARDAGASEAAGPELRFHRPDGRLLSRLPPPPFLPDDPVGALEREHAALAIDASTPATRWEGDRMDVDLVLDALAPLRRAEPEPGEEPRKGSEERPDGGENVSAETPGPDDSAETQAPPASGQEDVSAETPPDRDA